MLRKKFFVITIFLNLCYVTGKLLEYFGGLYCTLGLLTNSFEYFTDHFCSLLKNSFEYFTGRFCTLLTNSFEYFTGIFLLY